MLKGLLRVLDEAQMERIHNAAIRVLDETGLVIRGDFLLEALADAGCRVDHESQRVWFKPDLVETQIEGQRDRYQMVRSSLWYPFCREMPKDDVAVPDEFTCDYGFATPAIYDYPSGQFRSPTVQDQIDMIRLGDALDCVRAVCAPFICGDIDPRIEIIESSRLLLLNTKKPGWVGTSCAAEVKYLAELAALSTDGDQRLLRTQPPIFVHAYCTTSPLKLEGRCCEVLEEALKHKFPVNFAPMPILGGTTPVTPAGSAAVAAAEILGCMTATTLIAPDVFHFATVISGEMDMKTTQICYATPAAILTDAALHQLFRYKYGIVCNVEPAYIEAKVPGIQASFMKVFRQMALGSTVSHSLPIGLLDNGSVFSPTQAMIDLDANRAIYGFTKGIEVNDDTLCVDLINQLQFCEKATYLESDHTLRHFRDVMWDSPFFDRTYRQEESLTATESDEAILGKADQAWRDVIAKHQPIERNSRFVTELDRIVQAARKELLV
ncbi:MAG: trimethylamine methyltransferase family protein [Planctomycetes bacterium]|nr:trimethylamine methyltransferase family protein [Planctomycetota bacterium]MBL7043334.1 trimethylamine methyltransferase family protein [Pirellulaceae bacterium]